MYIDRIPYPKKIDTKSFSALIFDGSNFDQYRGVIIICKSVFGYSKERMISKFFNYFGNHEILEVGILQIDRIKKDYLSEGDVDI